MNHNFRITVLLKLILIFVIASVYNDLALAAQMATVKSAKAVIYADVEMTSPIGYVAKGKEVKVGDVARNQGQLLPIVVSGRIAYIKRDDIETTFDQKIKGRQEVLMERSRLGQYYKEVGVSTIGANNEVSMDKTVVGDRTKNYTMYGVSVRGAMAYEAKKRIYRLSFDYLQGSVDKETLSTLSIAADLGYRFARFSQVSFDAFAGLTIFPWVQYAYDSYFKVNGNGYGTYLGMQSAIAFGHSWALNIEGRWEYGQLTGIEIPADSIGTVNPLMVGMRFLVGVGRKF